MSTAVCVYICVVGIGTVPTMSMMPGTNHTMLTPIGISSNGLQPLTPMSGLNPLVTTTTGLSPLVGAIPTQPLMPTMGSTTLPNGTMGILQPMQAGARATGKNYFDF